MYLIFSSHCVFPVEVEAAGQPDPEPHVSRRHRRRHRGAGRPPSCCWAFGGSVTGIIGGRRGSYATAMPATASKPSRGGRGLVLSQLLQASSRRSTSSKLTTWRCRPRSEGYLNLRPSLPSLCTPCGSGRWQRSCTLH